MICATELEWGALKFASFGSIKKLNILKDASKGQKKFAVCVLSSRSGENRRADKRRLYSIWLADSVAF
jgi:plasmid maintenance system killer protein